MNKVLRRILLVFAILFVGFVSVLQQNGNEAGLPKPLPARPGHAWRAGELGGGGQATSSAIATESMQVTRVIDGDTIEITGGIKVRYIGVDTPELTKTKGILPCFGVEALKENERLVAGKTVRLEKDISDTDKYGRLLRYVYVGDVMVNDALVQNGFARVATYPPDVRYQERFLESERSARNGNMGLWKGCPR